MTEQELVGAVSRLIVGAPARIPLAEFVRAYDLHRSMPRQSPQFATLAATYGSEAAAVVPAIQKARQDSFFYPLWTTLIERVGAALAEAEDARNVTQEIASSPGTMQKVLRGGGFRLVQSWPGLFRAAQATGLVIVRAAGGNAYGTGFLVGPDLLITAAHVVDDLLEAGAPIAGSADRILVRFRNQLEAQGVWPIECRAVEQWLVALSPPHGRPPALDPSGSPEAAERLDFALIRLARNVGLEIGYLDIRDPPPAEPPDRLTVIGYPGGDECLSDDQQILELEAIGGRVRHGANTLAGMSGSPCVGGEGKVVALHEGAIETPPPYNRAVHLRSIRAAIRKMQPDPLEAETGSLWEISDVAARRAWIAAGQNRFASGEDRQAWLQKSVEAFDPATEAGARSGDGFPTPSSGAPSSRNGSVPLPRPTPPGGSRSSADRRWAASRSRSRSCRPSSGPPGSRS